MKRVFADAFFYIAVLNRKDAAHQKAIKYVASRITETLTTTAVLLEVADAMSTPTRRSGCAEFLADLTAQPQTIVCPINDGLFERGLVLYRSRPDKAWSLTDCISFVVMVDEGLTEALTGDHHFEQAGFRALLAD